MLHSKILLKITGSIAAYKTGTLISKLIQEGCEVQTVATKSALEFQAPWKALPEIQFYLMFLKQGE